MGQHAVAWAGSATLFALHCAPAAACNVCHTDDAARVLAGVFNADFPLYFAAILLPFVLIAAIAAWARIERAES